MSNPLPIKPSRDLARLRRLKTPGDIIQWLITDTNTLEKYFKLLKDTIDNSGAGTPNWDFRESTADEVTAGNAHAVGNILIIHKTLGVKREFKPPT